MLVPWHHLHENNRAHFLESCDTSAVVVASLPSVHRARLHGITMGEGNTITISDKAQWDEHIKSGKTVGRATQHSLHEYAFAHLWHLSGRARYFLHVH